MKKLAVFLISILLAAEIFASVSSIICGWQPGEIFFVAPIYADSVEAYGLYRSYNYGQDIEIIYTDPFTQFGAGTLLADVDSNTIYMFNWELALFTSISLSRDGGFNWQSPRGCEKDRN